MGVRRSVAKPMCAAMLLPALSRSGPGPGRGAAPCPLCSQQTRLDLARSSSGRCSGGGAVHTQQLLMAAIIRNRLGFALRETGQALERLGCVWQGINSYQEEITRLPTQVNASTKAPRVASTAWVAPSAQVSGDARVGDHCSLWYSCTVRGDTHPVRIGHSTNLQDGVRVGSLNPTSKPTSIGSFVSVGHGAVLQGCTVQDKVLVGMNAVLQDGVTVESGSIIAAGAVVEAGSTVPSGEVWAGSPARRLRAVKQVEAEYLENLPARYVELAGQHKEILQHLQHKMEVFTGTGSSH